MEGGKIGKIKGELGGRVKENVALSLYTTLGIGGHAKLLAEAYRQKDLINAVNIAGQNNIAFVVIAGGSNLLVSDERYDGFVIVIKTSGIKREGSKVIVEAGTKLQEFVDFAIANGLAGVECLIGIPGTIGGAIYGNAGAYGQTINDKFVKAEVFDQKRIVEFSKEQCKFSYRESIFQKNKFIILRLEFLFDEKTSPLVLKNKAEEILKQRLVKYPPNLLCPGSFFKNVIVADLPKDVLDKIPPERIVYGKIPAGYLLEVVGAKGKTKGKIKIADHHGNLFVNQGGGKASDFVYLAKTYARKVKDKFGIILEPEVQFVGVESLALQY